MELRQLKYFVRAAELLNFTQAAEDLFITQSTLSHQIKELENSLNVLLFDRVGKRVKLTEAGEIMLQNARKTLRQAEDSKQALLDLNDLKNGKLIIGSTYGLTKILMNAIVVFSQQYPDMNIQIVFGSTTELQQKLENFEIDCMLSFKSFPKTETSFSSTTLFSAQLSLIVHPNNPIRKLKKIALEKLQDIPLALPSESYSIRSFLNDKLKESKIDVHSNIEINDIHSLLLLVKSEAWCTVLMNTSLFDFPELVAIPLDEKSMNRKATLTINAQIYQKKALTIFVDIMKDSVHDILS